MDESYEGREQSAAKHLILESYLEKLAYKVGWHRRRLELNYIDGFAGPWESKSSDLSDTSPALSLRKLREVRETFVRAGKEFKIRAFFVSKTSEGAEQLRELRTRFPEAEVEIVTNTFERSLGAALRFIADAHDPFTFIFIDHTGWSGFGLHEIAPLLTTQNSEVLINFMTGHISRFIDSDDSRYEPSFRSLFGDESASYRAEWKGLAGRDREERIVQTYCQRVKQVGAYRHCASSIILNPRKDRTHFHLVYGTRSDEGLVTFRDVDRAGMRFQRNERAAVQLRERESKTGQSSLFGAPDLVARTLEDELHDRYLTRAFAELDLMLNRYSTVPWDELVYAALPFPTISEADVKEWLSQRVEAGSVEVLGLPPRHRVPKRKQGHRVRKLV